MKISDDVVSAEPNDAADTLALLAGRSKASAPTQAKSDVHLVERFQRGVYCRMHVEDGIQIGQF
jgi:hypothetical protein